jgi:ATP-dependent RNA helicase DHX57
LQALEAIHAGRLDYAANLSSMGFLPSWYLEHLRQEGHTSRPLKVGGTTLPPSSSSIATEPGGPDEFSWNARIVKAALVAGFYPRVLRVETPAQKYAKVRD